jgi:CelD/BcsL family acetyltransferase involved in cellulose biosynthesis
VRVQVEPVTVGSFAELGQAWRTLEAAAWKPSFFQSWTWVGCLAEERYDQPVLLRAEVDGVLAGLALFNRRRGRLYLAESGLESLDSPFIEHNAPLLASGMEGAVLPVLMQAAWQQRGVRRLVLGGVRPAVLQAAGGLAFRERSQVAPFIDLAAIRANDQDWLATLSANTRYQLRRSARHFAQSGPLRLDRAANLEEALSWFDALVALHGATWRQRGLPGAFAQPFALRFHRRLIECAQPRGELDLLRLSAGGEVLGYLYNFLLGGRIYAYQSGFDYTHAGRHGKPGLTCHAIAVEHALAEGALAYDFLAGAARYKLSLSNASVPLLWAETVRPWSIPGLLVRARGFVQEMTRQGHAKGPVCGLVGVQPG